MQGISSEEPRQALSAAQIVNSQKNKQKTTVRRAPSSGYSARRARIRKTQSALNYFGISAGTADGILGSNTRAGISVYQVSLHMPATGEITQFQRNVLMTAKACGLWRARCDASDFHRPARNQGRADGPVRSYDVQVA
jgi:peptidoglycan hydrolase-like protein with peptidoglycan-binding domain